MFTAVIRSIHGEYVTTKTLSVVQENGQIVASDPSANDNAKMICYCSSPIPYDNTHTTWIAAFTTPTTAADEPQHAEDMPFPLMLPLYPCKDIVILSFACSPLSTPRAAYLSWPPCDVVKVLGIIALTREIWLASSNAWDKAIRSLSLASWLSYAFDNAWNRNEQSAKEDDDAIVLVDPLADQSTVVAHPAKVQILSTKGGLQTKEGQADQPCGSSATTSDDEEEFSDMDAHASPTHDSVAISSEDDFDFENNSDETNEDESECDDGLDLAD